GTRLHAQVTIDAGAVVDEKLVELSLLVLPDVVEHLDRPFGPAPRHWAGLLAQLADDALGLIEVQGAAVRGRQQQLLGRVVDGLLPAEEVNEGRPHPLRDRHQRVADLLQNTYHGFALTIGSGVGPVGGPFFVAWMPGTRRVMNPSARQPS